jgi:hypothetical protein
MRQKISSIIAMVCITVYVIAIGIAVYRIITGIRDHRNLAEREFDDLAEVSSAAGVLGFTTGPFKEAVRDAFMKSRTLQAVIISGPGGITYAFERERGRAIGMTGDTPRFRVTLGLSHEPFFRPLWIEGFRNVTISAVSSSIDYERLIVILKFTLVPVLGALVIALVTLVVESLREKPAPFRQKRGEAPRYGEAEAEAAGTDDFGIGEPDTGGFDIGDFDIDDSETGKPDTDDFGIGDPGTGGFDIADSETGKSDTDDFDIGDPGTGGFDIGDFDIDDSGSFDLDSEEIPDETEPEGEGEPPSSPNIPEEAPIRERLASELEHCDSLGEDMIFAVMEFRESPHFNRPIFDQFVQEAENYFSRRELIFERGERGIAVIIPNITVDQVFSRVSAFHDEVLERLGPPFEKGDLCIGMSSRADRSTDADRLALEAQSALQKALEDPDAPVVAFKSDPEKYRAFMAQTQRRP